MRRLRLIWIPLFANVCPNLPDVRSYLYQFANWIKPEERMLLFCAYKAKFTHLQCQTTPAQNQLK